MSREPWLHRLILGSVPLLGTFVLCALPLLAAQAIGAGFFELIYTPYGPSLDERVMRPLQGLVEPNGVLGVDPQPTDSERNRRRP